MRVLFSYRYCGMGGVEASILARCDAFRAAGIDCTAMFDATWGAGGRHRLGQPGILLAPTEADREAVLAGGYDAVFAVDHPGIVATADRLGLSSPVFFESHASFLPALRRLFSSISRPPVRAVLVPSRFNESLVRTVTHTSKPILVLPNLVDLDRFSPAAPPARGIAPPERRILLWVGRLEDQKNPADLLALTEALMRRRDDLHLVLVGDADGYFQTVPALVGSASDRVRERTTLRRVAFPDEMPGLYTLAASSGGCLVSTSRNESFPISFLEAMACGCPVVSSDVGGARELVLDGITGRLFRPGDLSAATRALEDVLDDHGSRERLVAEARSRTQRDHSLHRAPEIYSAVFETATRYRGLLGFSSRPPTPRPPSSRTSLVSVIIPVHNRPTLVVYAVESALAQTHPAIEIILVDDGSTDQTPEVCRALASRYPQVRALFPGRLGSPARCREVGRLTARGEYLQYLDSDDVLSERKLEVMIQELREHPECDIAYCFTRRYRIGELPADDPAGRTGESHSAILPEAARQSLWFSSTPLLTRRASDIAGPWSDLGVLEDVEYQIRLGIRGLKPVHCKRFLADVRDHSESRLSGRPFLAGENSSELLRAFREIHGHLATLEESDPHGAIADFYAEAALLAHRFRELGQAHIAAGFQELIAGAGDPRLKPEPNDLRAGVQLDDLHLTLEADQVYPLVVRLYNPSSLPFLPGHCCQFGVSYHLFTADGALVQWDNARRYLDSSVWPGSETRLTIPVRAPLSPARYRVEVDVVWEGVAWLGEAISGERHVELTVV